MHHSGKYPNGRCGLFVRAALWTLLSALACALVALPGWCQDVAVPEDAISREMTVYNADDTSPGDAVSREITVYNADDSSTLSGDDAVSREITVYNSDDLSALSGSDAVSREITVYNADDISPRDAISREITVANRYLVDFRSKGDGEDVNILGDEGVVVTASFPDCIYVESSTRRYMGIKVTGGTAAVGDRVNVEGILRTDDSTGERYVAATSVWSVGPQSVEPMIVPVRSTYCSASAEWNEITHAGQRGTTDGTGACVIGVYLRITGKLVDTSGGLALDDGSDKKLPLQGGTTGFAAGDFVAADGVVSLSKSGQVYSPVFRVASMTKQR